MEGGSPRVVAKEFGMSLRTVRRYIAAGLLVPHRPLGSNKSVILFEDVRALVNQFPDRKRKWFEKIKAELDEAELKTIVAAVDDDPTAETWLDDDPPEAA